jgi:predicted secreted protein
MFAGLNGFVLYVMIWWTALFVVLPIGTEPVADPDPSTGGWRGAPARPRLLLKIAGTTVLATALFGVIFFINRMGWFSFRPD